MKLITNLFLRSLLSICNLNLLTRNFLDNLIISLRIRKKRILETEFTVCICSRREIYFQKNYDR